MKTRCLLVDDEPLATSLLENHISQLESFEVAGVCSNAIKAAEMLRSVKVDLMFLDINMPKISGIDFLKTLKNPPSVILTTAYREYALEGYELDIVDYLLKPITFDRFFKAIDRYMRLGPQEKGNVISPAQENHIYIKSGNKYHKLNTDDILYIESVKDYVMIHTKTAKLSAKHKISDLEIELDGKGFLRIHRSFMVNLKNITAFSPYDVDMGSIEVPIGASYKEHVFRALKN